ncbi:MAG: hypothetical protein ABIJ12_12610 [bacterium]
MNDLNHNKNNDNDNAGYEHKDVSGRSVILYGIIGVIVIAIFSFLLVEYFDVETEKMIDEMVLEPKSEAIVKLHTREAEELSTYKLLDPEKEIYRIPIDSAMVIVVNEAANKK